MHIAICINAPCICISIAMAAKTSAGREKVAAKGRRLAGRKLPAARKTTNKARGAAPSALLSVHPMAVAMAFARFSGARKSPLPPSKWSIQKGLTEGNGMPVSRDRLAVVLDYLLGLAVCMVVPLLDSDSRSAPPTAMAPENSNIPTGPPKENPKKVVGASLFPRPNLPPPPDSARPLRLGPASPSCD